MKENHLEDACLDWLANVGWTVVEGDSVAPGGELQARGRWSEVVLAPQLQEAVARLNPALSVADLDAVVAKIAGYGHQSLVDGNREIYDWLRNGVPLERTASDGRREILRIPLIDFNGHNDLHGAVALRSLLSGSRRRKSGMPLMSAGSLVRAFDQASAESSMRAQRVESRRQWTPKLTNEAMILPFKRSSETTSTTNALSRL